MTCTENEEPGQRIETSALCLSCPQPNKKGFTYVVPLYSALEQWVFLKDCLGSWLGWQGFLTKIKSGVFWSG